jgi:phage-related minor tail protein
MIKEFLNRKLQEKQDRHEMVMAKIKTVNSWAHEATENIKKQYREEEDDRTVRMKSLSGAAWEAEKIASDLAYQEAKNKFEQIRKEVDILFRRIRSS